MKQWLHDLRIVAPLFFAWRIVLVVIELIAPLLWPLRVGFLGPVHWANFDGIHYLSIANVGYQQYQQAFFPVYPLLIRHFSFLPIPPVYIALGISHIAFFLGLVFFYRLIRLLNKKWGIWPMVFFLAFPTSFFFAGVYTGSLYFLLIVAAFYFAEKKLWLVSSFFAMIASATRLFGVFMLPAFMLWAPNKLFRIPSRWLAIIPLGLGLYMVYLYQTVGDPLYFFHAQPAFGAERSGDSLILLPQVLWRYAKIITIAAPTTISYLIAIIELIAFIFACVVLWIGVAKRILPPSYLFYSFLVLIVPTLTGTLSSIPRYILSAFPLFFIVGSMHNTGLKALLLGIFLCGLVLMGTLFLQGYFVS